MKRRYVVGSVIAILLVALFAWAALATDAEMYFASDKNGENRVTNIQEGNQVWIVVYDPDENIDCDVQDKIWTDIKVMDPKTGAYIVWVSYKYPNADSSDTGDANKNLYTSTSYSPYKGHYPGTTAGSTDYDYLEETGARTGRFVSSRPFQIGSRENFDIAHLNTHVVDSTWSTFTGSGSDQPDEFQWGNYMYIESSEATRGWFDGAKVFKKSATDAALPVGDAVKPSTTGSGYETDYLIGRFENMDTIVGMYVDQNDDRDVAVGMMKIIDTEETISWDKPLYDDANTSATITVWDPDENLNCNKMEYVPVFIMVNPGSWNQQTESVTVTNFCDLKRKGGYDSSYSDLSDTPIRWYNIYDDRYILYPQTGSENVVTFNVTTSKWSGYSKVLFYAKETSASSGVFELDLNSILDDLGFNALDDGDVLVAYYLDPNDFDDFKIATSYIGTREHISITSFTDATRVEKSEYWIGRDPVYVQVIDENANVDPCCPEQVVVHICDVHGEDDSEWVILDETSSNSWVFFTFAGTKLLPVWDALGNGFVGLGGYQLKLDNWKLEVFNEDSVYARYNDVIYKSGSTGLAGLGDSTDTSTAIGAFPPEILKPRVENDVSFDLMEIGDTQVFNGTTTTMYFLDRQGNRVSDYVNSDCVFVEVIDLDQDEDQYRRERIAGYWDGKQNYPFGPEEDPTGSHAVNDLLGLDNISKDDFGLAKLYVLNPRSGHWAAVDLLENGVATGDFVSVICIDLISQYAEYNVPTLDVKPGDTLVAVYQDPSNHSDSAWISIKVGKGGGGVPPGQASSTDFVDSEGNSVATYTDADDAYVKVIDPSHAGEDTLTGLEVEGIAYDLSYLEGANTDTFITEAIPMADLGAVAGDEITANYTDATDSLDTSTDTVPIISSELEWESFIAKPNPFSDEATFTFEGAGIPATFAVTVYNMSGHLVWSEELSNVTEIVWDGTNEAGMPLANGPYIYVAMITDGTDTYTGKGKVFINK